MSENNHSPGTSRQSDPKRFDLTVDYLEWLQLPDDFQVRPYLLNVDLEDDWSLPHSTASAEVLEQCVETPQGPLTIRIQGDRSKPVILTYQDFGLKYNAGFLRFFNTPAMQLYLQKFCILFVNAPGQEPNAQTLPSDHKYPTMDELAEQLNVVLGYAEIESCIGIGQGVGANILARFALVHPEKVVALLLINCVPTKPRRAQSPETMIFNLPKTSFHQYLKERVYGYLMWKHFGNRPELCEERIVEKYKKLFESVNTYNVALFIMSYMKRTELNLQRGPGCATLQMPVMNIAAAFSPYVLDSRKLHDRLNPTNSTWLKIARCGMVLEEEPSKLADYVIGFMERVLSQRN